ncbi:MAG: hypothetical protein QOJ55_1405 [Solirubrobacteraceae bacterium]|nr:hypothetical protein [Solirubrobacteraceae bacterium]
MGHRLIICTAVAALALAGPAWAASPLDEYQQTGHITPCRYSSNQLQGSVPNDVAQYAPEYASQLQTAARERASGCGGSGRGGTTGRGASAGGAGGGSGSSSTSSGVAGAGTAAVASARKVRARARARRRARAQARLAAATVPSAGMSADARVPDRALLLAALPILLLLALAAAPRTWETVGRRVRRERGPARTPSGAIIVPPPVAGNGSGNGNGNGAAEVTAVAEAPTEETAALYPPATSRRRKTRYAAKSDGTA